MNNILGQLEKLRFLQNDFQPAVFTPLIFLKLFENILFAAIIFIIIYGIGRIIRKKFFVSPFTKIPFYFIEIAFGYIAIGSGLCILGIFSLFSFQILSLYFFLLAVIVFIFLIRNFKKTTISLSISLRQQFFLFISIVFILFTFFRLFPPEIGVDALQYHLSYPKLYIKHATMMLPVKGDESIITIPQLPEMLYVIPIFFHIPDASRYIHFGFFLLIVLLVIKISYLKKNSALYFSSVFFLTSPLVVHIASSANSDFQAVFLWLLSVVLLSEKPKNKNNLFYAALLFGGALASKIWMLAFFPLMAGYVFINNKKKLPVRKSIVFVIVSFLIVAIWYFRSFLLTGNPFYYKNNLDGLEAPSILQNILNLFRLDLVGRTQNVLSDFGPFFLLSIFLFLLRPIKNTKILMSYSWGKFAGAIFLFYLILPVYFSGRYFLPAFVFAIFIGSIGLNQIYRMYRVGRILIQGSVCIMLLYYGISTLILLPYGLGLADTKKYLARTFSLENATYYDFDGKFSRYINPNEPIITYGMAGFFYADFDYKNVYYFISRKDISLKNLKKSNRRKLLLRGGDVNWFCKRLEIKDCQKITLTLLASYLPAKQYLYKIE